MLTVENKGNVASIDVRERILRGEHPRGEILQFIKEAKAGTVIEINLPHYPKPLIAAIKSLGINAIVNELAPDHILVTCLKI